MLGLGRKDKAFSDKGSIRNLQAVLAVLVTILFAAFLLWSLWLLVAPATATERTDFVQAVAVLLAALAALVGLIFTSQNARTNYKALLTNLESTQRTLELSEEGQITERFTRAIDQLGATDYEGKPSLEIRLGGIYALERIANDSPDRDYQVILKILTAYVRENTKWLLKKEPDAPSSDSLKEKADEGTLYLDSLSPRADIQGILDVVSNLHVSQEDDLEVRTRRGTVIDLRGSNLEGAYFGGANLWLAILTKVNLRHAHLSEANLEGAWLEGSNLEGADMRKTNLYGAHLEGTNLEGAKSLTQEQIEQTIGTENTRIPEYLTMPEAWRYSVFEQHNRLIVGGM